MRLSTTLPEKNSFSIDTYVNYFMDNAKGNFDKPDVEKIMPILEPHLRSAYEDGYKEQIVLLNAKSENEAAVEPDNFNPLKYGHRSSLSQMIADKKIEIDKGFALSSIADLALNVAYLEGIKFANGHFYQRRTGQMN